MVQQLHQSRAMTTLIFYSIGYACHVNTVYLLSKI